MPEYDGREESVKRSIQHFDGQKEDVEMKGLIESGYGLRSLDTFEVVLS